MNLRTAIIATLLLAAPALTACGKTGDLERPGPLWGPDERSPDARAKEESARRAASAQANKPAQPGSPQEVRDPASSTATIPQQPIAGTNDPFGKPPQ
jgi:predicted small lipoprotein YifL